MARWTSLLMIASLFATSDTAAMKRQIHAPFSPPTPPTHTTHPNPHFTSLDTDMSSTDLTTNPVTHGANPVTSSSSTATAAQPSSQSTLQIITEGPTTMPVSTTATLGLPTSSATFPAQTSSQSTLLIITEGPTTNLVPTQTMVPGTTQPTTAQMGTATKDYEEALRLSLLFYYVQRSGQLPADNPISWRNDSALSDCVVGGWYDGGDHIKVTLPLSSALTTLLWGVARFQDGYQTAGQLDSMYDTVKWGLDYLLHAWDPFTQELVVQVGDPSIDHGDWVRPEDMTSPRPCIKVGPGRPGSDVAGQTVAALAAGAIVFRDRGNTTYARRLLETAESVYRFAEKHRGKYSDLPPVGDAWSYKSTGEKDEMCLAGVWLYKATGDERYLVNAKHDYLAVLSDEISWDDKMAVCQLMLYEETQRDMYKQNVENFLASYLPGGTKTYTPCGLVEDNSTHTSSSALAGNVGFYALLAADDGINPEMNRKWAAEQMNYLLGDNPHDGGCFSFEVGYGSMYPLHVHHRAASCPDPPAPCTQANLYSDTPNPHVLYGGLVGGPASNDGYSDTRQDAKHNGVAIVNNAGFQSALAGLTRLDNQNELPATSNKCPCGS